MLRSDLGYRKGVIFVTDVPEGSNGLPAKYFPTVHSLLCVTHAGGKRFRGSSCSEIDARRRKLVELCIASSGTAAIILVWHKFWLARKL